MNARRWRALAERYGINVAVRVESPRSAHYALRAAERPEGEAVH